MEYWLRLGHSPAVLPYALSVEKWLRLDHSPAAWPYALSVEKWLRLDHSPAAWRETPDSEAGGTYPQQVVSKRP